MRYDKEKIRAMQFNAEMRAVFDDYEPDFGSIAVEDTANAVCARFNEDKTEIGLACVNKFDMDDFGVVRIPVALLLELADKIKEVK